MALTYFALGHCQQAYHFSRQAQQISERIYEPLHLRSLEIANDLAIFANCVGEHETAVNTLFHLYQSLQNAGRHQEWITLKTANNLAEALNEQGKSHIAIKILSESLTQGEKRWGAHHHQILLLRFTLAEICLKKGDLEQALRQFQIGYLATQHSLNPGHDLAVYYQAFYGYCLFQTGRQNEGRPLISAALQKLKGRPDQYPQKIKAFAQSINTKAR